MGGGTLWVFNTMIYGKKFGVSLNLLSSVYLPFSILHMYIDKYPYLGGGGGGGGRMGGGGG